MAMSELSQQAQIRMQEMREKYKASLRNKQADIERHWESCMQSKWAEEPVSALKALVHKLAGSAGLYGFDALGDAARALDGALVGDSVKEVILPLMVNLEAEFKTACQ